MTVPTSGSFQRAMTTYSRPNIFGGELAAVENVETQKFLQEQLSGRLNYSQPVWIGLTRAQDNSTFAFPDGSIPKFWNWAREEPGNVSSGNVCVAMDAGNNGAWITYSCDSFLSTATRLGHVCEFASENKTAGAKTTPLPSTPSIPSIPSCSALSHPSSTDLVAYGNSCYLFVVARTASYYAVQDTCRGGTLTLGYSLLPDERVYRGQLAVIRDKDTQLFLLDQLTTKFNYSQPVWIGLVRDEPLGPFRTPEGITVEYPNFVEEDGSSNSTKGCVAIDPQSSNGLKFTKCSCVSNNSDISMDITDSRNIFDKPGDNINKCSRRNNRTRDINNDPVNISVKPVVTGTDIIIFLIYKANLNFRAVGDRDYSGNVDTISNPIHDTQHNQRLIYRGSELAGSVCQQCGDLDSSTPCSDEELFMATTSKCDDATPYCINDIFQNDGQAVFYKRCVNTELCTQLWYVESSDRVQCIQYDPVVYTEDLVCHLCCYGDTCNGNIVPPAETLFIPR
ncbi:hypothetical protein C0Q70_03814 [Pomacea canaliculata]|uniref:C-type lectin domain-containing protein n=1 Tax=Pomacea canaliculata TaxID=400727 RepID=A0A2T7PTS1_POMCA|nr:hypothetical protein C0Q70_03814 [Pomacea canaliculata]